MERRRILAEGAEKVCFENSGTKKNVGHVLRPSHRTALSAELGRLRREGVLDFRANRFRLR